MKNFPCFICRNNIEIKDECWKEVQEEGGGVPLCLTCGDKLMKEIKPK